MSKLTFAEMFFGGNLVLRIAVGIAAGVLLAYAWPRTPRGCGAKHKANDDCQYVSYHRCPPDSSGLLQSDNIRRPEVLRIYSITVKLTPYDTSIGGR